MVGDRLQIKSDADPSGGRNAEVATEPVVAR